MAQFLRTDEGMRTSVVAQRRESALRMSAVLWNGEMLVVALWLLRSGMNPWIALPLVLALGPVLTLLALPRLKRRR